MLARVTLTAPVRLQGAQAQGGMLVPLTRGSGAGVPPWAAWQWPPSSHWAMVPKHECASYSSWVGVGPENLHF